MFIWDLYYFDVIFVVLDIWTLSLSCGVFDWFGLWWHLTTCISVDWYEGFFEVLICIDVQATSRWMQDSWCLLDALWWASRSLGVWFDFMLLRSSTMGARCHETLTKEGHATIWIRAEYSCRGYKFQVVIWRNWRQVDALLRPSCTSGEDLFCVRTVCIRLHRLILPHFSSVHDTGTCRSVATSACDAGWHICVATYPWGPSGTNSSTSTCPFWYGAA